MFNIQYLLWQLKSHAIKRFVFFRTVEKMYIKNPNQCLHYDSLLHSFLRMVAWQPHAYFSGHPLFAICERSGHLCGLGPREYHAPVLSIIVDNYEISLPIYISVAIVRYDEFLCAVRNWSCPCTYIVCDMTAIVIQCTQYAIRVQPVFSAARQFTLCYYFVLHAWKSHFIVNVLTYVSLM